MGHAHSAPELPEITDEAGDSPKWVPLLGIGLFLLAVAGIVVCHGHAGDDANDSAAEAAQQE